MLWTDFSKKIVAGAMAPMLVMGISPVAAFAAEDASGGFPLQAAEVAIGVADDASIQDEIAATFAFSDSGITVSGLENGYKISGTTLTINAPGTYLVTGRCAEGNVEVKKGTTGVTLIMRDLDLTCSESAPLVVKKDNGDTALVVEGTVVLTDKEDPADEESADETVADAFEGAAVKVKSGSNLSITGTGVLTADGTSCKNAIKGASASALTIGGSVTVNARAANSGIASDGSVTIEGGAVNVSAENDGIKSAPEADDADSVGTVTITGGTVNVTAADDGIKADPDDGNTAAKGATTITGGTVTVNAGDDGIKAYNDLNIGIQGASNGPTINVESSTEGLEAATVNLLSGTGTIVATDDGINAANKSILDGESAELFDLNICGGTWTVNAQGDGLDSNGNITITGGDTVVHGPTSGGNGVFDFAGQGGSFSVMGGTLVGLGTSDMAATPTAGTYVAFGSSGMGGGMPGGMGGVTPGAMRGGAQGGMGGGMRTASDAFAGDGFGVIGDMSEGDVAAAPGGEPGLNAQAAPDGNAPNGNVGGSGYSISAGQVVTVKDSSGADLVTVQAVKDAQWVLYASGDLQEGQTYMLNADGAQISTASAVGGSSSGAGGGMQPPQGAPSRGQVHDGATPDGTAPTDASAPDGMASGSSTQGTGEAVASLQMFRLYNPFTGEHFYTSDSAECIDAVAAGWSYEGVGWEAPAAGDEVFRLYNPFAGEHHFTLDAIERDGLVLAGWVDEGVGWYSAGESGVPLYREYNPNEFSHNHNYTANADEHSDLLALGWVDEGIAWYGVR